MRDSILMRPVKDWDLATEATPDVVCSLFPHVIPTGIQHGTVTVVHEQVGYEVTTLRGDGTYSDGRRPDEVFFVSSITEDLARRDFTVNAIAVCPLTNEVVDPFGGIQDLEAMHLRAVGDPVLRFREDGLRIMRALRFVSTHGFTLNADTAHAMKPNLESLKQVSAERILVEWKKLVENSQSHSYLSNALHLMTSQGVLPVVGGPVCTGRPIQDHTWVVSELFYHSGYFIQKVFPSAPVRSFERFAAVIALVAFFEPLEKRTAANLHLLGKAPISLTVNFEKPPDSEGIQRAVNAVDEWMWQLKTSKETRVKAVSLTRDLSACFSGIPGLPEVETPIENTHGSLYRRWLSSLKYPEESLAVFVSHTMSAGRSYFFDGDRFMQRMAEEMKCPLHVKDLAVTGTDLQEALKVPQSKELGQLLQGLLTFVLNDPRRNSKELLLEHSRKLLDGTT